MTADNDHRPPETGGFRLNFILIAALHLLVLGAVLLLAIFPARKKEENVVWMNPGSFASEGPTGDAMEGGTKPDNTAGEKENSRTEPEPSLSPLPSIAPPPPPTTPEPTPEIPKATPTPKPQVQVTPTPPPNLMTPKPTPSSKPSPSATPKPSPKPTSKSTPKATPKPSAKSTAKPTPEENRTPKPRPNESLAHKSPVNTKKEEEKLAKNVSSPAAHKSETGGGSSDKPPKGNASSGANENGTEAASGNGEANFGVYAEIIKNRFDGAWNQPHGQIPVGSALVVTVHLKIEPDGTVTEFSIVEGSGNSVVDETVKEAGHKITRLPPPPGGNGFSPTVRFELRND
ncbi:MAG TPA: TonB family protein [Chthoniobacterales bacterium]|jgi:TonB family protein|nr:TonB family protein [Chthoniobacterales bacterium]